MISGGSSRIVRRKRRGRLLCVSRGISNSDLTKVPLVDCGFVVSATWPESVRRLASTFLKDPIRIAVGSDELSANKRIEQIVEVLDHSQQKEYALYTLLRSMLIAYTLSARMLHHLKTHLRLHPSSPSSPTRILVFALYKKEAQRLEQTLQRAGYNVGALHGDLSQDARFRALDKFKNGTVNVLVATDVAARGLDIPDVALVLNVTFPLTVGELIGTWEVTEYS